VEDYSWNYRLVETNIQDRANENTAK